MRHRDCRLLLLACLPALILGGVTASEESAFLLSQLSTCNTELSACKASLDQSRHLSESDLMDDLRARDAFLQQQLAALDACESKLAGLSGNDGSGAAVAKEAQAALREAERVGKKNKELEEDVAFWKKQVADLEGFVSRDEAEKIAAQRIAALEARVAELQNIVDGKETAQIAASDSSISNINYELKNEIENLRKEASVHQTLSEKLSKELDQKIFELKAKQDNMEIVTKSINSKSEEIETTRSELKLLKAKFEDNYHQLQVKIEEIKSLTSSNNQLEKNIVNMKSELNQKELDFSNLEKLIEPISNRADSGDIALETLNKIQNMLGKSDPSFNVLQSVAILKQNLETSNERVKNLEVALTKTESNINSVVHEKEQLKESQLTELAKLKADKQGLETEVFDLELEVERQQTRIGELEQLYKASEGQTAGLNAEKASLAQSHASQVATLQSRLVAIEAQRADLLKKVEKNEKTTAELEARLAEAGKKLASIAETREEEQMMLEDQIKAAVDAKAAVEVELEDARNQATELGKKVLELEDYRREIDDTVKDAEAVIAGLKNQLDLAEANGKEKTVFSQKFEEVSQKFKIQTKNLEDSNLMLGKLKDELSNKTAQISILEKSISSLNQTYSASQSQVETLTLQLDELTQKIKSLETERDHATKNTTSLENIHKITDDELNIEKHNFEEAERVILSLRNEKSQLESSLKQAETALFVSSTNMTTLQQELAESRAQISGLVASLEATANSQKRAEGQTGASQSQVETLTLQLDELTQKIKSLETERDRAARQARESHETTVPGLRNALLAAEQVAVGFRAQVGSLAADLQRANTDHAALDKRYNELEAALQKKEALAKDKAELEKQIGRLSEKILGLEAEKTVLAERVASISQIKEEHQLDVKSIQDQYRVEKKGLQKTLKLRSRVIEDYKKFIDETIREKMIIIEKNERQKLEISNQKEELESINKRILGLEYNLRESQDKEQKKSSEVKELLVKIDELKLQRQSTIDSSDHSEEIRTPEASSNIQETSPPAPETEVAEHREQQASQPATDSHAALDVQQEAVETAEVRELLEELDAAYAKIKEYETAFQLMGSDPATIAGGPVGAGHEHPGEMRDRDAKLKEQLDDLEKQLQQARTKLGQKDAKIRELEQLAKPGQSSKAAQGVIKVDKSLLDQATSKIEELTRQVADAKLVERSARLVGLQQEAAAGADGEVRELLEELDAAYAKIKEYETAFQLMGSDPATIAGGHKYSTDTHEHPGENRVVGADLIETLRTDLATARERIKVLEEKIFKTEENLKVAKSIQIKTAEHSQQLMDKIEEQELELNRSRIELSSKITELSTTYRRMTKLKKLVKTMKRRGVESLDSDLELLTQELHNSDIILRQKKAEITELQEFITNKFGEGVLDQAVKPEQSSIDEEHTEETGLIRQLRLKNEEIERLKKITKSKQAKAWVLARVANALGQKAAGEAGKVDVVKAELEGLKKVEVVEQRLVKALEDQLEMANEKFAIANQEKEVLKNRIREIDTLKPEIANDNDIIFLTRENMVQIIKSHSKQDSFGLEYISPEVFFGFDSVLFNRTDKNAAGRIFLEAAVSKIEEINLQLRKSQNEIIRISKDYSSQYTDDSLNEITSCKKQLTSAREENRLLLEENTNLAISNKRIKHQYSEALNACDEKIDEIKQSSILNTPNCSIDSITCGKYR